MTGTAPLDRRRRRRQETIEEVVDVAVEVMAEEGVVGLTLGEVARRMGIRPPSLYVYFDGKHALYDALFERGWRLLLDEIVRADEQTAGAPLERRLHAASEALVRWCVEHPAYVPLMSWRPIPGFEPTDRAYAPAVAAVERGRALLVEAHRDGLLRPDVDLDEAFRTWTVVTGGVISQQLANEPRASFETGSYTRTLPAVVEMWLARYR